jgi:uncharacterized membrane protein
LRLSLRAPLLLLFAPALTSVFALPSRSQTPIPAPPQPQIKKPPVGPAAPQSIHFPILLLAQGSEPSWSLRIAQKGPERLDRAGYPPIPLDPGEVTREGATDVWTYHAKDSATGADVAVHLTRSPCLDAASATKFPFQAVVEHAQIGTLSGCARIAAELFPRLSNASNQDEDDSDDSAEKKPPPPTITNFKLPSAVAFIAPDGRMIFKRGSLAHVIPGRSGYDFSISHDGRKLLFTRDEGPGPLRTINEYDFDSNRTKELLRGDIRNPVWSLDDSLVAYLSFVDSKWQLWTFPAADPTKAAVLNPTNFLTIQGWVDAHSILASDADLLYQIGDDGKPIQALSLKDLCGPEFRAGWEFAIRLHPSNPDLALVSAFYVHPPEGVPLGEKEREAGGLFLYEFLSKRRVSLDLPDLAASHPEWSRDGLQIYFSGLSAPHKTAIYRIFWDGTDLRRYQSGSEFVIGQ